MSDANEPDPVSDANEPDAPTIRVEVIAGGDPGDAVLAAVATILTRPVMVATSAHAKDEDEPGLPPSRWRRAARLEGIVPGRRITTRADLDWRRTA